MINNFKKKILSLSIISLFAVSCSQNKEIEPTILESETAANTTAPNSPTIVTSNPEAVVNGQQISAPNGATPMANAPVQNVAPGMNPPHGQPNHRCDISVGAPLNSPPGNAANTASQQTMAPVAAPTPAPANPLKLAVNPAHGEPGHSCAIAVGAPF